MRKRSRTAFLTANLQSLAFRGSILSLRPLMRGLLLGLRTLTTAIADRTTTALRRSTTAAHLLRSILENRICIYKLSHQKRSLIFPVFFNGKNYQSFLHKMNTKSEYKINSGTLTSFQSSLPNFLLLNPLEISPIAY
uniref:Uncharacterized protein n=1 Tax=Romanomermis culicivorax TaxID=13658 RepID=A0A915JX80_ROMCU